MLSEINEIICIYSQKYENCQRRPVQFYQFLGIWQALRATSSNERVELDDRLNVILIYFFTCQSHTLHRFIIGIIILLQASRQKLARVVEVKDLSFCNFQVLMLNRTARGASCPSCFIYFLISQLYSFHTYRRKCALVNQWHLAAFPIIIQ